MTNHQWQMFVRLMPQTPWTGGRLTDIDLITLEEAARFASRHAATEITAADFLRAGARGEILIRAICPRAVTMLPCRENDKPLDMPEDCIPTLPLVACQALSNTGKAKWRTIDGFENTGGAGKPLSRFTKWRLADADADIVTTPDNCRISGLDVHSLADAFMDKPSTSQVAGTTATVPGNETIEDRNGRWLDHYEVEIKTAQRGAYARGAANFGVERSKYRKAVVKARASRAERYRADMKSAPIKDGSGVWGSQLVKNGKRTRGTTA